MDRKGEEDGGNGIEVVRGNSPWFSWWDVNKDVNLRKMYYLRWRKLSKELKIQKKRKRPNTANSMEYDWIGL